MQACQEESMQIFWNRDHHARKGIKQDWLFCCLRMDRGADRPLPGRARPVVPAVLHDGRLCREQSDGGAPAGELARQRCIRLDELDLRRPRGRPSVRGFLTTSMFGRARS